MVAGRGVLGASNLLYAHRDFRSRPPSLRGLGDLGSLLLFASLSFLASFELVHVEWAISSFCPFVPFSLNGFCGDALKTLWMLPLLFLSSCTSLGLDVGVRRLLFDGNLFFLWAFLKVSWRSWFRMRRFSRRSGSRFSRLLCGWWDFGGSLNTPFGHSQRRRRRHHQWSSCQPGELVPKRSFKHANSAAREPNEPWQMAPHPHDVENAGEAEAERATTDCGVTPHLPLMLKAKA